VADLLKHTSGNKLHSVERTMLMRLSWPSGWVTCAKANQLETLTLSSRSRDTNTTAEDGT
jgi:hypothetical protein